MFLKSEHTATPNAGQTFVRKFTGPSFETKLVGLAMNNLARNSIVGVGQVDGIDAIIYTTYESIDITADECFFALKIDNAFKARFGYVQYEPVFV